MAQHDYVIDNGTGSVVRADINSVLQAIASNNSGGSDPSTTYALQYYADTGDTILKLRNAANDGFVNLRKFDGSLPLPDGSSSSPSLFFDDDTNTGIFSAAADTLNIATAGSERVRVDSSGNVGIGTASAAANLHIKSTFPAIRLEDNSDYAQIDANSGTLRLSADAGGATASSRITFNVDGSERMRIDSSGKVGIGTTSPEARLEVIDSTTGRSYSLSSQTELVVERNGNCIVSIIGSNTSDCILNFGDTDDENIGSIGYDHSNNSMVFRTNDTVQMTVDSSGNFAVGTTSPDSALHVYKQTNDRTARFQRISTQTIDVTQTSGINAITSTGKNFEIGTTDSLDLIFDTADSERMRIDSSGVVGINKYSNFGSSANAGIELNGANNYVMFVRSGGTGVYMGRITNVGEIVGFRYNGSTVGGISTDGSNTAYNTSSDYRLKENATAISDGITRLKTLKPYKFNFIGQSKVVDGFFAHEVTAVPEAITGTKDEVVTQAMIDAGDYEEGTLNDPIYQGIDQSKLVPLLTAALQEAVAKLEVLETKVAALEAA